MLVTLFFFFKQKTAYEMLRSLVGSEMCIRDSFKWEPRGKRRIHQKPNSREIAACRPWLEAELRIVKPNLVVAMGATAAQAIFGPGFRVTRERGKVLSSKLAPRVLATVHPSSLLRQTDEASREREYKRFVADLRAALKAAREE